MRVPKIAIVIEISEFHQLLMGHIGALKGTDIGGWGVGELGSWGVGNHTVSSISLLCPVPPSSSHYYTYYYVVIVRIVSII